MGMFQVWSLGLGTVNLVGIKENSAFADGNDFEG